MPHKWSTEVSARIDSKNRLMSTCINRHKNVRRNESLGEESIDVCHGGQVGVSHISETL